MSNKTKTKLSVGPNGNINKEEVPVFEVPTELKKVNFKPEGRLLLIDPIPLDTKNKDISHLTIVENKENGGMTGPALVDKQFEVSKLDSGLFISKDIQKDISHKGVVIATGGLVEGYEVGDIVTYKPNISAVIMQEICGYKLMIMEQYNILGKYTN